MPEAIRIDVSLRETSEEILQGMVECPKLGGQAEKDVVREIRDDWCRTRGLKCCIQFDIWVEPPKQDMVDCVHEESPGGPIPKSYAFAYLRDDMCRKLRLYCCLGLSDQALKRAMGSMAPGGRSAATDLSELLMKLRDDQLSGFPDMPEDQCDVRGNFINCAVNGKFRLNIMLPEGEICPRCGVYLKKAQ